MPEQVDSPTPPADADLHAARVLAPFRVAELVAAIAAALFAIGFYLHTPSTLPSNADYRAVAAALAPERTPGDAVLLDPAWAERARLDITGLPVLNLGRHPVREDLERYRRLFVLSLPRLPRSDRERTFRNLEALGFKRVGEPRAYGGLSLTEFGNDKVELPAFDFTAQLPAARVFVRKADGTEEVCPLKGNRHPCPRAPWMDVVAEIREIDSKPVRCIWAHPAGREPLVFEYKGVALADSLRVMGGIVGQIAYRHDHYGPVELAVKIDGEPIGGLTFPPGEPGERRRAFDTRKLAGTAHDVTFEVTAPNPDMRHFCFDAGTY